MLAQSFQYPYLALKLATRKARAGFILAHLLSCCVDKKQLKKDGISYLKGNELLAMDVLALMDHVKILLEYQLGVNLKSLDQTASLRASEYKFEEQYDMMAKTLMKKLTDKDYAKVTAKLNK